MTAVAPSPVLVTMPASTGSVQLRIIDPIECPEWDALIATHPHCTFFHSRAWAQTLAGTYGFNCQYVVAERNGRLHGLLPIIETRSWIRGIRAISLPFTDECPALTSAEVNLESLLDAAAGDAETRRWTHLGMSVEPEILGASAATHYTHQLPLGIETDDLFDGCDSATRRAVRKAERSGVSVRFANDFDAVRDYYRLHCRTRARLGSPPQPFRFFAGICQHILQQGRGFVALAIHRGRVIAGAVFFEFAGMAVYKFSASDERFQELRASNLVIWRAIEKLVTSGARELNFGRTSLANGGLRRFKLGWGAQEQAICRGQYCFETRSFEPVADLAHGFHTRLIAALPPFVSRWIGTLAYPHLS